MDVYKGRGRNAERLECRTKIRPECRTSGMPKARSAERSDFEVEGITEIPAEHIKCRTVGMANNHYNYVVTKLSNGNFCGWQGWKITVQ